MMHSEFAKLFLQPGADMDSKISKAILGNVTELSDQTRQLINTTAQLQAHVDRKSVEDAI